VGDGNAFLPPGGESSHQDLAHLLRASGAEQRREFRGEGSSNGTSCRRWRNWVIDYQRALGCRGGCPIGSLGSELAETEPQARDHVSAGMKRWGPPSATACARCTHAADSQTKPTPTPLALALLAALQGDLLLTQIERDTKPLQAALEAMLDLIATHSGTTQR